MKNNKICVCRNKRKFLRNNFHLTVIHLKEFFPFQRPSREKSSDFDVSVMEGNYGRSSLAIKSLQNRRIGLSVHENVIE